MTQDDIIRMAREAGFDEAYVSEEAALSLLVPLERLAAQVAALAAAAEREACAKIVETYRIPVGNSLAGEMACEWTHDALKEILDDIRARGNK